MHINSLKSSKFLKKEDCEPPILVTIKGVTMHNVAKEGAPDEEKACIEFDEHEKPMVLNSTNGQVIASIVGDPETDNWPGHKIVLFNDPNVSFAGKIMGGIRVRAPRQPKPAAKPTPKPAPEPAQQPPEDDDVNF